MLLNVEDIGLHTSNYGTDITWANKPGILLMGHGQTKWPMM